MMEQAKQYLTRYQEADTLAEKKVVVSDYQAFLETLSDTQRDEARTVMAVLWPGIKQRVGELEPKMQTLDEMVERLAARQVQA